MHCPLFMYAFAAQAAVTQAVLAVEPVAPPVTELVGQAVQAAADAALALNVSAAQAVTEPADPV